MTGSSSAARRLAQPSSSMDVLRWNLHPRQLLAFESRATETLYGGAAGGGKSYLMRLCAIAWA